MTLGRLLHRRRGRRRDRDPVPDLADPGLRPERDDRGAGRRAARADRPPENVVHISFQLMVLLRHRARSAGRAGRGSCGGVDGSCPSSRWWLGAVILSGPAAVLALEAGWTTTEVGRQPWIAYEVLRVADAVTDQPGVGVILTGLIGLYVGTRAQPLVRAAPDEHPVASRWRGLDAVRSAGGRAGAARRGRRHHRSRRRRRRRERDDVILRRVVVSRDLGRRDRVRRVRRSGLRLGSLGPARRRRPQRAPGPAVASSGRSDRSGRRTTSGWSSCWSTCGPGSPRRSPRSPRRCTCRCSGAAAGIVFRGGAFVFRKSSTTLGEARFFGALFALSSVITPFFLGAAVGAVASGRVPAAGDGDPWTQLAHADVAARRGARGGGVRVDLGGVADRGCATVTVSTDLVAYFRRRSLVTGVVVGVIALVGIVAIETDAATLASGLHGRALAARAAQRRRRPGRDVAAAPRPTGSGARPRRPRAVVAIVLGWGVGQYPWMLVDQVTIDQAAAPSATLWALLVAFVGAARAGGAGTHLDAGAHRRRTAGARRRAGRLLAGGPGTAPLGGPRLSDRSELLGRGGARSPPRARPCDVPRRSAASGRASAGRRAGC